MAITAEDLAADAAPSYVDDVYALIFATQLGQFIEGDAVSAALFAEWVSSDIAQSVLRVEPDLRALFAEALTRDISGAEYERALKKAYDLARIETKTIATNMSKAELEMIGNRIADGLKRGLGPKQIARQLEMVKGLDSVSAARYLKAERMWSELGLTDKQLEAKLERFFQKLLRERKERIAATESRLVTSQTRIIEASDRGAKWKMWVDVGDERVSDGCASNSGEGPILINNAFGSGDRYPPRFPGCRCHLEFGTSDVQKEWMEENSAQRAEKLEEARAVAARIEEAEKRAA